MLWVVLPDLYSLAIYIVNGTFTQHATVYIRAERSGLPIGSVGSMTWPPLVHGHIRSMGEPMRSPGSPAEALSFYK